MSVSYRHPRPAVTVDCVIFRRAGRGLEVLLIQRKATPFRGRWALPGGFVDRDEDLADAARRELREETGLRGLRLEQFHAFGTPGRDPRGHTVSIAYVGLLTRSKNSARAGDDAAGLAWFSVLQLPPLGFDHRQIIQLALKRVRTTKAA
jgi:8-oxo-dGTP diphosphatase